MNLQETINAHLEQIDNCSISDLIEHSKAILKAVRANRKEAAK